MGKRQGELRPRSQLPLSNRVQRCVHARRDGAQRRQTESHAEIASINTQEYSRSAGAGAGAGAGAEFSNSKSPVLPAVFYVL
jgi:phage tail tape-measure protein